MEVRKSEAVGIRMGTREQEYEARMTHIGRRGKVNEATCEHKYERRNSEKTSPSWLRPVREGEQCGPDDWDKVRMTTEWLDLLTAKNDIREHSAADVEEMRAATFFNVTS